MARLLGRRRVWVVVSGACLAVAAAVAPVRAENLHRTYGPAWTCAKIEAPQDSLRRACQLCEDIGMQFDRQGATGGRCVGDPIAEARPTAVIQEPAAQAQAPAQPQTQPQDQAENQAETRPAVPRNQTAALPDQPQDQAVRKKGNYGAIAVSADTLNFASAMNYRYQDEAEKGALSGCAQHAGDCRIATTFWDGACGALATGSNFVGKTGWGSAWAVDAESAQATALKECGKHVNGCKIKFSKCTVK